MRVFGKFSKFTKWFVLLIGERDKIHLENRDKKAFFVLEASCELMRDSYSRDVLLAASVICL